jgi:hypothetical protein
MPSARALRVICRAKFSSLPPIASATTTAASFADLVTIALMASSTAMLWPALSSSLVGDCTAACADTGRRESSFSLPASSCSNSR